MRLQFCQCVMLIAAFSTYGRATAQETYSFDEMEKLEGLTMRVADVKGHVLDCLSLNGTWKFNAKPSLDFWQETDLTEWQDIEVPGEWVMQGFEVLPSTAAGYVRSFKIPKTWSGKRVKLRFDALFSIAQVYVNGNKIGRHEGGFTPFEFDITKAIKFGSNNVLAVAVTGESLADRLASASKYAVHALGGITRKVTVFAVPEVNIKSYHIATMFDNEFDDAVMSVSMKVNNEAIEDISGAKLEFDLLKWPQRKSVELGIKNFELPVVRGGEVFDKTVEIEVDSPAKWDGEHPNLYVLQCRLVNGSKTVEIVERRFGFRQVEVRGSRMFVNNQPVKLRGINRHEAHPLRGRSLTMDEWRTDVELFRAANCNIIRTSHYPPAQEFVDLCDEMGLFVELEVPLCWVDTKNNIIDSSDRLAAAELINRQTLESIERDKSHPSILFWSLANESIWCEYFQKSYDLARAYDSSRPFVFHNQRMEDNKVPAIANCHYPGPTGPEKYKDYERPVWFGEYCHLNAYNRYELWTDPGLRDAWAEGFKPMWDNMYAADAVLGGAIWSGIDDTFCLPSGDMVGYGTWGPLDGWRRTKPEYWHIKKVYSPVRIDIDYIEPTTGGTISIPVENRHNFSNINELDIKWRIGSKKGTATADIAPRESGQISIGTHLSSLEGKSIYLQFNSPLGFVIDEYLLPIGIPIELKQSIRKKSGDKISVKSDDNMIIISATDLTVKFDKKAGMIVEAVKDGNRIFKAGPELMILPLNKAGDTQMTLQMQPVSADTAVRSNRRIENVSLHHDNAQAIITVKESYDIAGGGYKLTINANGTMLIDYEYEMIGEINARQYGMVITLPGNFNRLHWKRKGLWNVYPDDHIGRLEGVADAFVDSKFSGIAGPAEKPGHQWRHDANELGTNDFRSTKENILNAYLSSSKCEGPIVVSDGSQHVRCWVEGDVTRMLIADYSNLGSERFFRKHAALKDKPLKGGDTVSGTVCFK